MHPKKTEAKFKRRLFDVVHKVSRRCLKCSKEFPSTGPGNRLCMKCNRDNLEIRVMREENFVNIKQMLLD